MGLPVEYSVACRLSGLLLEQSINDNAVDTIAGHDARLVALVSFFWVLSN